MYTEDWSKHIKINRTAIAAQLDHHFIDVRDKVTIRMYTLKPSGNLVLVNSLCDALHSFLAYYVYGEADITKHGDTWAGLNAKGVFGHKDPSTDGKFGELLLFALVESFLNCKMIAHKIRSLTNNKDQLKGGDGIFLGNYLINGKEHPAYLIGESKVTTSFGEALNEALDSLNRFTDVRLSSEFLDNELIVAQEFVKVVSADLDELYDRLTPTTISYKNQVLVHPVLLMYKTDWFGKLETKSATPKELGDAILNKLSGTEKIYMDKIVKKTIDYPQLQKIYLDFFILPCTSVDDFRNAMYYKIHGAPYVKPAKDDRA
ncbi:MAG TPA: DUF1837 domain-containing protein [Pedobacter sp.]|nr:DUF1837 domain-containing protein [Pedobacter sp.]